MRCSERICGGHASRRKRKSFPRMDTNPHESKLLEENLYIQFAEITVDSWAPFPFHYRSNETRRRSNKPALRPKATQPCGGSDSPEVGGGGPLCTPGALQ